MELDKAKELIKKFISGHSGFIVRADVAERYYKNENDILLNKPKENREKEENPLRNADNRISHNFHGLLVNQKASYLFTAPPLFDVGEKNANTTISDTLGDKYAKVCKDICVNASNTSVAWIHYWEDENNKFQYGVVDSKQIIPIISDDLTCELMGVLRVYRKIEDNGKAYNIYEIWNESECESFRCEISLDIDEGLETYMMFSMALNGGITETKNTYTHKFGRVPFIPFYNNNVKEGDLKNIKGHIDIYDKIYSGFVNDLEDIQEVIFVLSGYGGTDLKEFLRDMKQYKAIKLDEDEDGKGGVSTLSIQIPVEAREKLLTITRKEIFEQGQGVDPQPENYGNASGEALKFMYALLEMKAGLAETEFRSGFGELVKAILDFNNMKVKNIIQTWTRTAIKNETEQADICNQSVDIISRKTILKNHPLVEDADAEEIQIKKEKEEAKAEQQAEQEQIFGGAFSNMNADEEDEDDAGGSTVTSRGTSTKTKEDMV